MGNGISQKPRSRARVIAAAAVTSLIWASSAFGASIIVPVNVTVVPPMTMGERCDMRVSGLLAGPRAGTIKLAVPSILPDMTVISNSPLIQADRPIGIQWVAGTSCLAAHRNGLGALQFGGPPSGSFSSISTETTATLSSGNRTITMEGIQLRYGANGSAGTVRGSGVLGQDGNGTIVIGGALNVGARQANGTYSGALRVSLDY